MMEKNFQNPYQVCQSLGINLHDSSSIIPALFGNEPWEKVYDTVRGPLTSRCRSFVSNPVYGKELEKIVPAIAWANPELAHEWFKYLTAPITSKPLGIGSVGELAYQPHDVTHIITGMIKFMIEIDGNNRQYGKAEDWAITKQFPHILARVINRMLILGSLSRNSQNHRINLTTSLLWTYVDESQRGFDSVSELENLLKKYTRCSHVCDRNLRLKLHGRADLWCELQLVLQRRFHCSQVYFDSLHYKEKQNAHIVCRMGKEFLMTLDYAIRSNLSLQERYL